MKLRSGKTIEKSSKVCGHTCELWHDKCCACSDKRQKNDAYVAYNQSHLDKVSIVARDFRYCPTCKKSNAKTVIPVAALVPVEPSVEEMKMEAKQLKKAVDLQKEVIESLNKTIAIYETRMARMEKENTDLKKEREQRDKEKVEMNLYESGLDDMCYHFGFCSDVIGDCWLPDYESGGLSGLKKSLRETSKFIHKGEPCEVCKTTIDGIHD